MKLLRVGDVGFEKPAALDERGILRDLSSVINDISGENLLPEMLERLQRLDLNGLPKLPTNQLRIASCVGNIGKVVCIGLNYSEHIAEVGLGAQATLEPSMFGKWTSSICGPYDDIEIPRGSIETDWETELAIVIGKPGKYIEESDAFDHIAGYCLINDISEREYQTKRGQTWAKGKGCDTFAPLGPWLVTKDDIPNPQDLNIWFELNGKRYQDDSTAKMIHKIPFLISYISQFMSLQSGDIIATGSPAGAGKGQTPPIFMKAGDELNFGIEGLGQQRHKVVNAL